MRAAILVMAFLTLAPLASAKVQCHVDEILKHCPEGKKCSPGNYRSDGKDATECERRALKLCKELCESHLDPSIGKCECGKPVVDK